MKKNVLLAPVMAAFLFTACNNTTNEQGSSTDRDEVSELQDNNDPLNGLGVDTADSAQPGAPAPEDALEWAGTYEGTLPCADCPGIKMELKINSDETYSLYQELLDTDMKGTENGTFAWDEASGLIVLKNNDGREDLYQLEGNQIFRLDPDGNKVEGEQASQYILKKTGGE